MSPVSTRGKFLEITLDDQSVLNYERRRLPGLQRGMLEQMDQDMEAGILLDDRKITTPTRMQCAQYVVMQLHRAIETDRTNKARLMCSWLATRMPDLKEIRISTNNKQISCEFVRN